MKRLGDDGDCGTIRCGSFVASCVAENMWEFTCDWLPEFRQDAICDRRMAADCIIRLQAEYRKEAAS